MHSYLRTDTQQCNSHHHHLMALCQLFPAARVARPLEHIYIVFIYYHKWFLGGFKVPICPEDSSPPHSLETTLKWPCWCPSPQHHHHYPNLYCYPQYLKRLFTDQEPRTLDESDSPPASLELQESPGWETNTFKLQLRSSCLRLNHNDYNDRNEWEPTQTCSEYILIWEPAMLRLHYCISCYLIWTYFHYYTAFPETVVSH